MGLCGLNACAFDATKYWGRLGYGGERSRAQKKSSASLAKWAQDAAHGITCRKSAEGGITEVVMRLINYIK